MNLDIQVENIGKSKAIEYLKKNIHNRKPVRANIDFLKNEILEGRFLLNGQTITFDIDGNLADGQHRLIAISELDIQVPLIVVRGVGKDSFKTIDTGRTRGGADVLSIEKIPYHSVVASAIQRILHKFHQDRLTSKTGSVKFSNSVILDFYNNNKDELMDCVFLCADLYNTETKIITPSVSSAMLFLLKKENPSKAKSFIRELYTGKMETSDVSALTLRKRLINHKIDGFKLNDTYIRNLFLSAFRGYCQNKNLSKIQVNGNQFFKID